MTTHASTIHRHQNFRTVVDASATSPSEVRASIAQAMRSGSPTPFLIRLSQEGESLTAWARPCDQSLSHELAGLNEPDLTSLLREEHRVGLAMEEEIHSVEAALERLAGDPLSSESLLLLDDDLAPARAFTRTTAAIGAELSTLALSARLPYNPREMQDRTLVAGSPVLLEMRLGPEDGDSTDPSALVEAAELLGRQVYIEAAGRNGIEFVGSGSASWQSPNFDVGDGTEPVIIRCDFVAAAATVDAAACVDVRLFVAPPDLPRCHGDPVAELSLEFTVVTSLSEINSPALTDTALASAPVWLASWPILLRPTEVIDGFQHFAYFTDGDETTFQMAAAPRKLETQFYGDVIADLTESFSRSYKPADSSISDLQLDNGDEQVRLLARIGARLHEMVFGKPNDPVAEDARAWFRRQEGPLWVRDGAPTLLWELFFDGDPDAIDTAPVGDLVQGFWGYRFQVEHLPRRSDDDAHQRGSLLPAPTTTTAFVHPAPAAERTETADSDEQLDHVLSKQHDDLDRAIGPITRVDLDLISWLEAGSPDESDVLYLFGHGTSSTSLRPANGTIRWTNPDEEATLDLTGSGQITLGAVKDAVSEPLRGNPLVFLNACETLLVDPAIGNPFIEAFYRLGRARAVIGCVAEVPAAFAVGFAHRVLDRFYAGVPIGEALHTVKRELLEAGNPYGLLYTLYGPSNLTLVKDKKP